MGYVTDLDQPIMQISGTDVYKFRDLVRNVAVIGGIGSGKTSGTGKLISTAILRAGAGLLVMVAKADEVERWLKLAKENGRSKDIVLFGDDGKGGWTGCFNFIDYELKRQGQRGLGSVIECIMQMFEADRMVKPGANRAGEAFWDNTSRQLLRNSIPVLYAAYGTVTLEQVRKFINSAPRKVEDRDDEAWRLASFLFRTMYKAKKSPLQPMDPDELELIHEYWGTEFAEMDRKLRSNIISNLSTTIDRFLRGRLRDHFCRETTITPDMCFDGKIIIMSMPALTWNEDGIIAQQLFKFIWQRVVLTRNALPQRFRERFVACFADECQYFMNRGDRLFLSSARDSRATTIYLTQSYATFQAVLGDGAKAETDTLIGLFSSIVLHSNSEFSSNEWASKLIGRSLQGRKSYSKSTSESRGRNVNMGESTNASTNFGSVKPSANRPGSYSNANTRGAGHTSGQGKTSSTSSSDSESTQEVMDFEIEPAFFARELKTGGPGGIVEAVWFYANGKFRESGRNYLFVAFKQ